MCRITPSGAGLRQARSDVNAEQTAETILDTLRQLRPRNLNDNHYYHQQQQQQQQRGRGHRHRRNHYLPYAEPLASLLTESDILSYVCSYNPRLAEACGVAPEGSPETQSLKLIVERLPSGAELLQGLGDSLTSSNKWAWAVLPHPAGLAVNAEGARASSASRKPAPGVVLHFLPSFSWEDPYNESNADPAERLRFVTEATLAVCPDSTPRLYCYDVEASTLGMEYLGPKSSTLRESILGGKIFPNLGGTLGRHLGAALFENSAFGMTAKDFLALEATMEEKKESRFTFGLPRHGGSSWGSNGATVAELAAAESSGFRRLSCGCQLPSSRTSAHEVGRYVQCAYGNPWCALQNTSPNNPKQAVVAKLEALTYQGNSRHRLSLVHGNLNLGRIFVAAGEDKQQVKILPDEESARVSNPALDVGMLIGQLLAAFFALEGLTNRSKSRQTQQKWILSCISDLYNELERDFLTRWNDCLRDGRSTFLRPANPPKFPPPSPVASKSTATIPDAAPRSPGAFQVEPLCSLQAHFMSDLFLDTIKIAAFSLLPRARTSPSASRNSLFSTIPDPVRRKLCQEKCERFAFSLAFDSRTRFDSMHRVTEAAEAACWGFISSRAS